MNPKFETAWHYYFCVLPGGSCTSIDEYMCLGIDPIFETYRYLYPMTPSFFCRSYPLTSLLHSMTPYSTTKWPIFTYFLFPNEYLVFVFFLIKSYITGYMDPVWEHCISRVFVLWYEKYMDFCKSLLGTNEKHSFQTTVYGQTSLCTEFWVIIFNDPLFSTLIPNDARYPIHYPNATLVGKYTKWLNRSFLIV